MEFLYLIHCIKLAIYPIIIYVHLTLYINVHLVVAGQDIPRPSDNEA